MAEKKIGSEKTFFIETGTLFLDGKQRKYVVTDVYKGDNFFAGAVYEEKGEVYINPLGYSTIGTGEISEILGRMTEQEMLEASERGYKADGLPFPQEIRRLIARDYKKSGRNI